MSTKSIHQKGTVLTVIFFIVLLFMISQAYAVGPYTFSLDSFQVIGNLPGNLVDEFDDGIIDPWVIFDPTVVESGGLVTFSNPGTIEGVLINGYYSLNEFTYLGSGWPSPFTVENGSGDFTGISKWVSIIPGLNQVYDMKIDSDPGPNISLGVANFDNDITDLFGLPAAGLNILFSRTGGDIPITDFVWQSEPISETDITGDIILRLHFDDNTDQFTADFSLDGGLTFQNPFTPIGWGIETPGWYEWYFTGQSSEVQTMTVFIDIKPGSDPNSINLGNAGVIPVAIFSSDTFDATTIVPETVTLAGASVKMAGKSGKYNCHDEDVDEDGMLDKVCQVYTNEFIIEQGAATAVLEAETTAGEAVRGEDSIRIVQE